MSKNSKLRLISKKKELFNKVKEKYLKMKEIYRDVKVDIKKRLEAGRFLYSMRRYSWSKINRVYCPITGNSRGLVAEYQIDRRIFYKLASEGKIPGVITK